MEFGSGGDRREGGVKGNLPARAVNYALGTPPGEKKKDETPITGMRTLVLESLAREGCGKGKETGDRDRSARNSSLELWGKIAKD